MKHLILPPKLSLNPVKSYSFLLFCRTFSTSFCFDESVHSRVYVTIILHSIKLQKLSCFIYELVVSYLHQFVNSLIVSKEFVLQVSANRMTCYVFSRSYFLPLSVDKKSLKWRNPWRKESKGSEKPGSVSYLSCLSSPENRPDPRTLSSQDIDINQSPCPTFRDNMADNLFY